MRIFAVTGLIAALMACAPPDLGASDYEPFSVPDNEWPGEEPPADLIPENWTVGNVAPQVEGMDQHGTTTALWQFWGKYTVVDVSTLWCAPCQELARSTEDLYQHYGDYGVIPLSVIIENESGGEATQEELELWATWPSRNENSEYEEITAPIISDFKGKSGSGTLVRNGQYPAIAIVGPDLRVRRRGLEANHRKIELAVEEVLCEDGITEFCR